MRLKKRSSLWTYLRILGPCAVALMAVLAWPSQSQAATYYVATNGNDSFDGLAFEYQGGASGPFRTIRRAAVAVRAGDTVQIRAGTYQEYSTWVTDGTQAAPITITSYRGETVLISGNGHTIPAGTYGTLLSVKGDWYTVSNLQVGYSSWYGLAVEGTHCTVDNVYAHHNWSSGIYTTGWYNLIVNCRAYSNSLINEDFRPHEGTWGFGISACRNPQYTTIRGCTAWNNWGEGISTFESYHITIEDCTSYNNQQNFYISDTKYCLFQRNLSYYTPGNRIQNYDTQCAILVGNEGHVPACSDNTIINNVCLGGERNIAIGSNTFENTLVAYNTFVNASDTAGPESACVYIFGGSYGNARFQNNIALQEDGVPVLHLEAGGVTFGYNNWSRTPAKGGQGSGDVINDPLLARTGSTDSGSLKPGWFEIQEGSPARDRAKVLANVTEDLLGNARGSSPDMGAFEFTESTSSATSQIQTIAGSRLSVVSAATPVTGQPSLVVSLGGTASGGTPPYSYFWRFGDGSTSTSQFPSHTFIQAGTYTVVLSVSDAKSAKASSSVRITVRARQDASQLRHDRKAAPRPIYK